MPGATAFHHLNTEAPQRACYVPTLLGLLQPALYAATKPGTTPPGFRDITAGNNDHYKAAPGWDPCTGLGVPDGTALLVALTTNTKAPAPSAR